MWGPGILELQSEGEGLTTIRVAKRRAMKAALVRTNDMGF
jgi:hypothetical protein